MKNKSTLEISFFQKDLYYSFNKTKKFELTLLENNCYVLSDFSSYEILHGALTDWLKVNKELQVRENVAERYYELLLARRKVEDIHNDIFLTAKKTDDPVQFQSFASTVDFSKPESEVTSERQSSKFDCESDHYQSKFIKCQIENGSYYEGYVSDRKANGFGTHFMSNGDKYIGEWKDNQKHGRGFIHYSDGGYYYGDIFYNQAEGHGESYYINGDYYCGEYKNGSYNGFGEFNDSSGVVFKGIWKNGSLHGNGVIIDKSGNKIDITFEKGKIIKRCKVL